MKIANHGWLKIAPWEIFLPFKTMKNTKTADLVLFINSSYDKDDLLQKNKNKNTTQKVWFGGISLQPPWLGTRKYMVSFLSITIFVLRVVQTDWL